MGHGDQDDMPLPTSESLELSLGCAGVSALELIKGEGKTVARPICRPKWKNLCLASGFFDSSGLVKIPAMLASCLAQVLLNNLHGLLKAGLEPKSFWLCP